MLLATLKKDFPIKGVIQMLNSSPHPMIGVVDKSFGSHYQNLRDVITGLKETRQCVSVVLYIECGPCRHPRRPKGLFPLIAPSYSISGLNNALETSQLRALNAFNKRLDFINSQLPVITGVHYVLTPGLEDNFALSSFKALRSLVAQSFHGRTDYTINSNRVDNRTRPGPWSEEIHTYDYKALGKLVRGDIVAGDGYTLCLASDRNCKGYSVEQVGRLLKEGEQRGIGVMLWRPEWQGLPPQTPGNVSIIVRPEDRKYRLAGLGVIKKLLRNK